MGKGRVGFAAMLVVVGCSEFVGVQAEGNTGANESGTSSDGASGSALDEDETGDASGCEDGVRNGDEQGVDCGGACPPCDAEPECRAPQDCGSGVCDGGRCRPAECADGVRNGGESDVDCGGRCAGCEAGASCASAGDCASLECDDERCQSPSCDDGVRNGTETAIDCGGDCKPCPDRAGCAVDGDCISGVCGSRDLCLAATCSDGVRNGIEADVDCGGSCGDRCVHGQSCSGNDDCGESSCLDGTCVARLCAGLPEGTESGVHALRITADAAETTPVLCDMDEAGGGWTLILAYDHLGGTNPAPIAGSFPTAATGVLGHVRAEGLAAIRDAVGELRFYCETSLHPRVLHFSTARAELLDFFAGVADSNTPDFWSDTFVALEGHTAALPGATDFTDSPTPDERLTGFPFWRWGEYHWAVGGYGDRWECDDWSNNADNDTLHQVWVR